MECVEFAVLVIKTKVIHDNIYRLWCFGDSRTADEKKGKDVREVFHGGFHLKVPTSQ